MRERLLFLRRALASPRHLGSITPSSRYLVDTLLDLADLSACQTIVELGPGTGPFTAGVLERMPAGGRLLCIERDADLAAHLAGRFPDPRLIVVTGDAQDLERHLAEHGLQTRVPLIISGLPFTSLPPEVREGILDAVTRCLGVDGVFLLYQYSIVMRPLIRRYFRWVRTRWEPRNIPPAFAMRCAN